MKKVFSIIVLVTIVSFSCKTEKDTRYQPTQMERVMAIHDEVMPKMGTIGKLVAELKPKVDTTTTGLAYKQAMIDLQDAHTSMMDWMKGFGDRFDHEEILKGKPLNTQKQQWLDEEEVKVKEMKEKVNSSISKAQKLLEKKN
ncbi:hypothetical protein ACJD0Z_16825 [Flavobacteriaceae bacterium M23B6Z8]